MSTQDQIEDFIRAAVACVGWTTPALTESGDYHTENGQPVEYADDSEQWDDLAESVERENRAEWIAFIDENYSALAALSSDFSQHGHDYVLTAGGHGAGFWDRGYPADIEGPVTAAARMGSSHVVMVDESGTLHYSQD